MGFLIGLLILAILALIILSSCCKDRAGRPQAMVVERLGAYPGDLECRSSCESTIY